jgi:hypothetical protein
MEAYVLQIDTYVPATAVLYRWYIHGHLTFEKCNAYVKLELVEK